MLPNREFSVLDINAEHLGVPTSFLMDNAGRAVADLVTERFGENKRILVVCGAGNNGGDGFVAAKHLKERNRVQVVMAKRADDISTLIARDAYEEVKDLVVARHDVDFDEQDVIVDALLGTGVSGSVREPYAKLISKINRSPAKIVSVDVPSGLGARPRVKPHITVTFHDLKEGMDEGNSGDIVIADIGIPEETQRFVGPGEFAYYPIPSPDSHKGMNGRVLIIGGGPYSGAPALAGFGAFGIKVDLVHIATPERTYLPIASYSPNFIVHSLPGERLTSEHLPLLKRLTEKVDAVLIGPGLGDSAETKEAVRQYIRSCKKPMVIDADGIAAVAEDLGVLQNKTGVVTPHAREFELLARKKLPSVHEERAKPAMELSRRIGLTILIKGRLDVIADGQRWKLNRTGNAGMSVGGTGDVLAGEVAGLLSRGVAPFDAARIAAFTNGYAGDLAYEEKGFSLLATDVAAKVPLVIKPFIDRFL